MSSPTVNETRNGEFSVLMCGVGGQGLVMLSNIIGNACANEDLRVITGEQHGLSQRSGTISIHLRIGKDVRSPLIPIRSADAILSLEAMEALRYIEYIKDGGIVISNSRVMHPVSETLELTRDKTKQYFGVQDIEGRLRKVTDKILFIDALSLALKAGSPLAENVVMLGAMSVLTQFPINPKNLKMAVEEGVPDKAREINLKAFILGAEAAYSRFCDEVPCRTKDQM